MREFPAAAPESLTTTARRWLRAARASFRATWLQALAYPWNIAGELLGAGLYLLWSVAPMLVAFHHRDSIAGWSREEALIVAGFFLVLEGLLEAFIDPNLRAIVEHVRQGTLDHVLLKPVDALFLLSFQRSQPTKVLHSAAGLVLVAWANHRAGFEPGPGAIALSGLLLALSFILLHALWTLAVSMAFWFVRVDNLSWVLHTGLDAARWPLPIYRGVVRVLLTWVLPLGLLTTWPALALRNQLGLGSFLAGAGVVAIFAVGARVVWTLSLRRYGSASS